MGYYNSGFYAPAAAVRATNNQADFNEGQKEGRKDADFEARGIEDYEARARRVLVSTRRESQWPNTPWGRGFIAGFVSKRKEVEESAS